MKTETAMNILGGLIGSVAEIHKGNPRATRLIKKAKVAFGVIAAQVKFRPTEASISAASKVAFEFSQEFIVPTNPRGLSFSERLGLRI